MTREHEQAIKNLESFIDHFHTNIKQAEKANDCAFDFTQAEDDIITFGIAIQAIKDLEKYKEPYNKGYEDGVKATNKDARIYVDDTLDEIMAEIEEQVLESLSDGGDDWFAAEKVNDCLEIIDKHREGE